MSRNYEFIVCGLYIPPNLYVEESKDIKNYIVYYFDYLFVKILKFRKRNTDAICINLLTHFPNFSIMNSLNILDVVFSSDVSWLCHFEYVI